MAIEQNQSDSIDKVLAALRKATPPEGMEARIAHRLQSEVTTATPAPSRLRYLLAAALPTATFCRGALTGAAIAAIALWVMLPVKHPSSPQSAHVRATTSLPAASGALSATPVAASSVQPANCRSLALQQAHRSDASQVSHQLVTTAIMENFPHAHAARTLPLTAQEFALARLATTANPAVLAALNPENQAKQNAQESAEFFKFFTPPPPPSDLNPGTVPPQTNE